MGVRKDLGVHTLNILRNGDAVAELTDAIAECVRASEEYGKDSTVTVKLKFKPNRGQVFIEDEITTKPAKPTNPATIAFCDVHGNVSRQDPRQQGLELKAADTDEQEPRRAEGYDHD